MSDLNKLAEAVFEGDMDEVKIITQELVDAGIEPLKIVNEGLLGGMELVAPKFKAGEMFIPEVMLCAKSLGEGLAVLKPLLNDDAASAKGTFLMGTVKGDLHDIGKNLVVMLVESGGFNVVDLGIDVPAEKFVEAIKEHKPAVVGLCALLTTTMTEMQVVIDAVKEAGLREQVKILVGGAPLYPEFAEKIGADGYCPDAIACKEMVAEIVAKQ